MTRQDFTLSDHVIQWVESWVIDQKKKPPIKITPLAGDGSQRTFYRLETKGQSFVLLSDPKWILSRDYPSIQAFLKEKTISVPEFYFVDEKNGFLVMEDLGDVLLQQEIQKHPSRTQDFLEQSVVLLANLHAKTYPVPNNLPVFDRSFDVQKYSEELAFFDEHFRVKWKGLKPFGKTELDEILKFCSEIAQYKPQVFCHRDYHTRNILIREKALFLIDFQDARMGSNHYDLASLLFDAYVPISEAIRNHLIGLYQNELTSHPINEHMDWGNFKDHLYKVAYQRVIKAMGSFASFYTRFGKTTHLKYVPEALKNIEWLESKAGIPTKLKNIFNFHELKD